MNAPWSGLKASGFKASGLKEWTRAWSLAGLAALGLGCGMAEPSDYFIGCRSDAECEGGAVCFADGCGDPGKNIVVEVIADPKGGEYAQDLALQELRDQQTLELRDASALKGQVRMRTQLSTVGYSAPVEMVITGESLLIPGRQRHQRSELVPQNGVYTLPVGSGRYTVTVLAANKSLPPVSGMREISPGQTQSLDFLLPDTRDLRLVTGRVLRQEDTPMDVALEIQALDANLAPLTQRIPVQRDTGQFILSVPVSALAHQALHLQVVPTSADVAVPLKLFSIDPLAPVTTLLMGDYGEPVKLQGRVLGPDRKPVAKASVYLSGTVGGGGQYRSARVQTQTDGTFTLTTLPSDAATGSTLTVTPPPGSAAGVTVKSVTVPRASTPALADIVCGSRVKVMGSLLRPSGSQPAAGVRIRVWTLEEVEGSLRPIVDFDVERGTDENGRFELSLDPGRYRLDFARTEDLPSVSRIVTIRPPGPGTPPEQPVELPSFTLSKGRRVTGQVVLAGSRGSGAPAPNASVRFFRVVDVEGKRTYLELADTLTKTDGSYATTLPTR
ncbi:carboxypeptidase regulatory-like domain-containing protein [Melittangium boletus]|uniref:carboxypeptidase regulatory-like domain-containing protein n=1 Tax=Melittangium boletus TaxID=83453 RepID=UPI003DA54B81